MSAGSKDREIIRLARKGSPSGMRELFHCYAGYMTAVCARYIDSPEDVRDVLQDCLIKINAALPGFEFREGASLKSWLSRICVNESLRFLKQKGRSGEIFTDSDPPDPPGDEEPDIEGVPPEAIHGMIRKLPPGYRTVFNLFVFEQKSHKEIADLLGIKEDSSASQFHRARQMLIKMIKEYKTSIL